MIVPLPRDMSTSPTDSAYSTQASNKRRRTSDLPSPASFTAHSPAMAAAGPPAAHEHVQAPLPPPPASQIPPGHIPKRGARACTACRKGKNRCEGDVRVSVRHRTVPY